VRALVVSNMAASREQPARGVFVRDQVAALRARGDVAVELYEFAPGALSYPFAALALRRRYAATRFDIVHAHFGLTAWPALALRGPLHVLTLHGTDVRHPRSRAITLAALPHMDLVATVSRSLAQELGPISPTPAVLPCGIALDRFRPIPRDAARLALGLDPDQPCLLFPADPRRAVKRFDRALEVAGGVRLITLGATAPDHVTLAINAANAVLVPSEAVKVGKRGTTVTLLVKGPDGKDIPTPTKVRTGGTDGTFTEIRDGVKEGDKIVLAGLDQGGPRFGPQSPFGPSGGNRAGGSSGAGGGGARRGG